MLSHLRSYLASERGGGGDEKAARRQEDVARQREETLQAGNQILSQLTPGSDEFRQMQQIIQEVINAPAATQGPVFNRQRILSEGNRLVAQHQQRIAAGGPATPLEARTDQSLQQLRGTTGDFIERLRGTLTPTTEEADVLGALRGTTTTTPSGQIFQDIVGRGQQEFKPEDFFFFEEALPAQLALAEDAVKRRAAQRGVLGSGIELEDLGRTGVELAVREAQAREDSRQEAVRTAEALRQASLGDFQNLFNVGQQLRGREIGGVRDIGALETGLDEATINLQQGREAGLTDLLSQQTFARGTQQQGLLGRQTGRAEDLFNLAEQRAREREAAIASSIGQLVGTAATFIPGVGPIVGPAISAAAGAQASPTSLLAQQRAPSDTGVPADLSGSLSINPSPVQRGQLTPEELLKLLAASGGA